MDRWRPPAAGLVGYLPDDRKHAFPFPSNLLELLKARESLLKQNAAASPMAKHFDIGHDAQFDEHAGKLFAQH